MSETDSRKGAEEAMRQSFAASRRKDLAAAERWSKIAERLTASAEKLDALPPGPDDPEEEERLRQELRVRLMRFVEDNNDVIAWEREALAHHEALARGETPEPLRMHPSGPLEEHDALERVRAILAGHADRSTLESPQPTWPWDENGKRG